MASPVKKFKNVHDSVRPLILLLKVSGFAIFSIDPSLKVSFTVIDCILNLLHLILILSLNCMYWNTYFGFNMHTSEIVRTFYPIMVYLSFIIFNSIKVWTFFRRHKLIELLKLLQEIDDDFVKMGFIFDYAKHRKTVVKVLSFTTLIETATAISFYLSQKLYNQTTNSQLDYNVIIFTFYGFFLNLVLVTLFFTLVCGVKYRFEAMKEILR